MCHFCGHFVEKLAGQEKTKELISQLGWKKKSLLLSLYCELPWNCFIFDFHLFSTLSLCFHPRLKLEGEHFKAPLKPFLSLVWK